MGVFIVKTQEVHKELPADVNEVCKEMETQTKENKTWSYSLYI